MTTDELDKELQRLRQEFQQHRHTRLDSFAVAYLDLDGRPTIPTDISAVKYIVQEASSNLSAEQSLGALTTGLLKNTVTAGVGVLSTASLGTDYAPGTVYYDAGNSGTSKTINWSNGIYQKLTLTGNCTLTFSNPVNGRLYLKVIQGSGPYTITWPTIKWENTTAPTLTTTNAATDLIVLLYDGTDYLGSYSYNFG